MGKRMNYAVSPSPNWPRAYMQVYDTTKVWVAYYVFPYMVVLHMHTKWITGSRCKLDSAPPFYKYVPDSAPTKREGAPKSKYTEIRTRTATDNESSCARGEDSLYPSPQALATTAREIKTRVRNPDIASLYADAVWSIRTFFITLRAFPQTAESPPKWQNQSLLILYKGVHWFDLEICQT